jgi:hypothetical protein
VIFFTSLRSNVTTPRIGRLFECRDRQNAISSWSDATVASLKPTAVTTIVDLPKVPRQDMESVRTVLCDCDAYVLEVHARAAQLGSGITTVGTELVRLLDLGYGARKEQR